MRILIDECIDEHPKLVGRTRLSNGPLRRTGWLEEQRSSNGGGSQKFEVFLTVDQGIEYQQNLEGRKIAIIIFRTKSNRLKDLLPLVSVCLEHVESIQPGQIVRIDG